MQQKFQAGYKSKKWFDGDIEGSPEELQEAFEVSSNYLYKILDYAERDELIPKEDWERERRIFQFCMQGPKAGFFRLDKREKMTSADVLYILSTTLPETKLAERLGVNRRLIREIRTGINKSWYWEYLLIRRLKAIIRTHLTSIPDLNRLIYTVTRVHPDLSKEILCYATSKRKARKLRESFITKGIFKKLKEDGTLDILYPIEPIDVL